ncbi:MAG TPA: hypothetical protein VMJ10_22780 [Kofleriaceae bacterium]|nr:hypothetical protein [Kofleriaceae bacterium]
MTVVRPLVLALAACSVPDIDYTGKQCPCPAGYACDDSTHTCVRGALAPDGAAAPDGPNGDGAQEASCLPSPLTTLHYSTATFADFSPMWSSTGGIWQTAGAELQETSTVSQLAVAYHADPAITYADARVVGTMHAISAGPGDAIELALRVDAMNVHMYHCNWEPADGGFLIQRTDNVNTTPVIQMTTLAITGRSVDDPVIMEFQVSGDVFTCCLHGIPGAMLTGTDGTYTDGSIGVKTYEASAGFSNFQGYIP